MTITCSSVLSIGVVGIFCLYFNFCRWTSVFFESRFIRSHLVNGSCSHRSRILRNGKRIITRDRIRAYPFPLSALRDEISAQVPICFWNNTRLCLNLRNFQSIFISWFCSSAISIIKFSTTYCWNRWKMLNSIFKHSVVVVFF